MIGNRCRGFSALLIPIGLPAVSPVTARRNAVAFFLVQVPTAPPTCWLVGRLEFNVRFQHKYGYIRDDGLSCDDQSDS